MRATFVQRSFGRLALSLASLSALDVMAPTNGNRMRDRRRVHPVLLISPDRSTDKVREAGVTWLSF